MTAERDFRFRGSGRQELLVLSHRVPFPPHNGAAIRTFGLIQALASSFELTILCFDRVDSALNEMSADQRIDRMRELGRAEAVGIGQQTSYWRLALDHLASVVTSRPYTYFVHRSPEYDALLKKAIETGRFAAAHVDSIDLVRHLPTLGDTPLFLTHHNIESQLLRRRASSSGSVVLASYMRHQAGLVEAVERRWARRAALNIVTSEQDAAELRRLVPGAPIEVVPNAVDAERTEPVSLRGRRIVFVGGTNYFPNLEALHWFGREVLPILRQRGFDGGVDWVGRATPEEQDQLGRRYGIRLTGYVDDIRPYFEAAGCFVAPLQTGGGTRLKILDAWSHGLPVVSTSLGCEGLNGEHGDHLLVADSPDAFATAVEQVLGSSPLQRALADAGRQLVRERFSWDVAGNRLVELYTAAISR